MIKSQFMENFQHLSTEASSSGKVEKGLDKALVLSPIGQFSALAGEAQDPNESEDDQSDDSGTMEDYWDSFIEVQTQKLSKLEKTHAKRSSGSRGSSIETSDKDQN